VQAVQGSVWNGLSVGVLELDAPGASLRLEHLELKVEWPRLLERQLHIDTLRADTVWVDLKPVPESPDDPPGEPFDASSLPVSLRADAVAVGELILSQEGRPLPYTVTGFSAALAAGPQRRRETRSEEHTSELQSRENLVCRLLLEEEKIRTDV